MLYFDCLQYNYKIGAHFTLHMLCCFVHYIDHGELNWSCQCNLSYTLENLVAILQAQDVCNTTVHLCIVVTELQLD